MTTLTPSPYQAAVSLFIKKGKRHGFVSAVAGSGKTWTLANIAAPAIRGSALFCSFGKEISLELGRVLPKNFKSQTIHALGFGMLKRSHDQSELNPSKYKKIVRAFLQEMPDAPKSLIHLVETDKVDLFSPLIKLADYARNTLVDAEDRDAILDLAHHFEIEIQEEAEEYVLDSLPRILRVGREACSWEFDYTDCLWLAATDPAIRPWKRYDWILVDEAQDLNAAQLATVLKALKQGGRLLFVGDPRQAIMGFAGADCDSVQTIVNTLECTELPLSVCYRCPTSHLDLAREIVPHIENAPGAKLGTVETINRSMLNDTLVEGDMVLCRSNAPLVELCFNLIADGRPARIKGRKIGEGLIAAAKKIAKRRDFAGWNKFGESVDAWTARECKKIIKRSGDNEDPRLEGITDRAMCLKTIWSRCEAECGRDFEAAIEDLFSDGVASIQLSSVHRAKGLEAESVFILCPELLPGPWARPGTWQFKQEENLHYVALTRSLDALTFVISPPRR